MTVEETLLQAIVQQAKTLVTQLEVLIQMSQQGKPACQHPQEQVICVGTMGHMSRFCKVCEQELPGSSPDTLKEGST
jgi:hypothetical protein